MPGRLLDLASTGIVDVSSCTARVEGFPDAKARGTPAANRATKSGLAMKARPKATRSTSPRRNASFALSHV